MQKWNWTESTEQVTLFPFYLIIHFAALRIGTGSDKLSAEIMTTVQGDDVI